MSEKNNVNEQRLNSFNKADEFCKNLKDQKSGIEIKMVGVNEVGGISEEHYIYYKGKLIAHIPPRPPALFGYEIWSKDGEKVELKTGKANRVYTDDEMQVVQQTILKRCDEVQQVLNEKAQEQRNKEKKAQSKA